MSESPVESTTPADHTVLALKIEAALLPDWFDELQKVAARLAHSDPHPHPGLTLTLILTLTLTLPTDH